MPPRVLGCKVKTVLIILAQRSLYSRCSIFIFILEETFYSDQYGENMTGKNTTRQILFASLLLIGLFLFPSSLQAQERLCDTSFEDCRDPLWRLIDAETEGIDVAFWFMQDSSYANKLILRKNAGVRVRVIVDPRANPTYPGNQQILDQLQAAGIPMRYKLNEGILHNKAMIFSAQGKVEFSGSNYNDAFLPYTPY